MTNMKLQIQSFHFNFYCQDEDNGCLVNLMSEMESSYERIIGKMQYSLNKVIDVFIYPDFFAFRQAFGKKRISDWTVGAADDKTIRIVSPYRVGEMHTFASMMKVVVHELVHVFVNNFNRDVPLWLNEGIAMVEAGQNTESNVPWTEEMKQYASRFYYSESINLKPDEGWLRYYLSYHAVSFIIKKYGYDQLVELIKCSPKWENALPLPRQQFQNMWEQYLDETLYRFANCSI